MYIIQLIKIGTNEIIKEIDTKSEINANEIKNNLERDYNQDNYYTELFCSDCGNESCSC